MTSRQTLLTSRLHDPQLLGTDGVAPTNYDDSLGVRLGFCGTCSGVKTVCGCIVDNSASVADGNDPIGNRFREIRHAIHQVARHCRCGKELAAILHFDTPTSGDVMPVKLNSRGLKELEQGLSVPPDGAGRSSLSASLARFTEMANAHPDYRFVLSVLSDMELIGDPPDIFQRLIDFPGDVHAVVLRAQPPQVLVDAPNVLVTRVQPTDPPGAVAKAILASMTMHRKPRRRRPFGKKEAITW